MAVILLIGGCRNRDLSHGRVPGLSSDLVVVPGAFDVRSATDRGLHRLQYKVHAPYPASDLLVSLANELEARGWRPLENNWFNRDQKSAFVQGWDEYVASKGQFAAVWWTQWKNKNGEVLDYALVYTSPGELFTNKDELFVTASKMSLEIAEQLRVGSTSIDPVVEVRPGIALNTKKKVDRDAYTPGPPTLLVVFRCGITAPEANFQIEKVLADRVATGLTSAAAELIKGHTTYRFNFADGTAESEVTEFSSRIFAACPPIESIHHGFANFPIAEDIEPCA